MSNHTPGISPKWFFQLLDAVCLLAAFAFAYWSLPLFGDWLNPAFAELYETSSAILLVLALPLWLLLLDWTGMYGDLPHNSVRVLLKGMIQVTLVGWGLLALIIFGIKEQGISRLLVFTFGCYSFALLTAMRIAEQHYYRMRHRAGYYSRNVLVIGSNLDIQAVQELFKTSTRPKDYRVFEWPVDKAPLEVTVPHCMYQWEIDLRTRLRGQPVDEVVVVSSTQTDEALSRLIAICSEVGRPLRLVPRFELNSVRNLIPGLTAVPDLLLGLPSLLLLRAKPEAGYLFIKRLIDVFASAALLVVLSPVFAIVAFAIKISSHGPIFYRWRVFGQNNKEFVGYKFRSMVANADELKQDLLKDNEMAGPVFKMRNDPRVTPVGRVLRKYSLDELPQLWNVLKGDMSLVGPRPPLKQEFERFEFWQARKLSVRPGMTCLWQVSGRNQIKDFDEWARLDLEYIDRRSLALDFEILLRTGLAVLRGTGL